MQNSEKFTTCLLAELHANSQTNRVFHSYRTRFIAPIRSVHKTCTQRTHERSSERAYTTRPNLREDPVKADSGQRRHALKTILENPKLQPTPRRGLPQYPRIRQKKHAFTCKEICRDFNYVKEKETLSDIVISAQGTTESLSHQIAGS